MPWNGSGQFNRTNGVFTGATVWDESRVAGRTVRSDDHDTHDEDIATGMENTVTRDGQNQPTTNLPMGGFRHTNVDDAAARTDYVAAGQIQDQDLSHIVPASVGGTGDAITLSPTPAITAYAAGQRFSFVAEATNTGAVTVDVSTLGTKAVQKLGAALVAGDITTGDLAEIEYDGTQFQMLSPARDPVLTAGSIVEADLADDAVTTDKIADANVTTAKVADNAITLAKLAGGTAGNLITYDASGDPAAVATGTSGQALTSNGAGAAPTMQDVITVETEQSTGSGTAFDFTGISAAAKRITIMFEGVSLSGTDNLLIQIGDSGGLETTGYVSSGSRSGSSAAISTSTAGFLMFVQTAGALVSGHMILTNISGDGLTWVSSHTGKQGTANCIFGAGNKTLSAVLDRVTITRDGSDTFDAGSVNIFIE
ncbi:MAG: hypothetical protein ACR2RF_26395 [Geminicoccaceae bacterium]